MPWLYGARLKGVVYSSEQGISGRGSGTIRFATVDGVLELAYKKPLTASFKKAECNNIGAVWTIWATVVAPGQGSIDRAECDGQTDDQVTAAWLLTTRYLNGIADGRQIEALGMRTRALQNEPAGTEAQEITDIDLSGFKEYGRGQCLTVSRVDDANRILIDISQNCFPRFKGDAAQVRFVLAKGPGAAPWLIDHILVFSVPRLLLDIGSR